MIQFVVEKLQKCPSVADICVATSTDRSDDPLQSWCDENNLRCVRGSLLNVAERVLAAAETMGSPAFFRVNGDSPLLVTQLLDWAWKAYTDSKLDLVSNVHPRSFPPGLSVELINTNAMRTAVDRMTEPADREHVTRYFYTNPDQFAIKNLHSPNDYSAIHLAVDTESDFAQLNAIIRRMQHPHWSYDVEATVALYREVLGNA